MARILNIISSPRGSESNSIKLANAIITKIKQNDPGVDAEGFALSDVKEKALEDGIASIVL
ncbi:hypothetical protein [Desertivirga xinjiangensis]|uniref:hypothetical protein n=1 Tax=Desertivirga xinjiangensis TaxID=539206 RepID=UPI00210C1EBC|nr:hypothetical protein [Pedobacter xinjiangensis]